MVILAMFTLAISNEQLVALLSIAKKIGARAGEECVYGNLGNAYHWLGNFQQAIDYQKECL